MLRYILVLFLTLCLEASTLHLATSTNPARLNPILATDSSSSEIASFIFSGLVKFDKDSKEIVADLAKKFYFKDSTTLIFELREDVYWHDGEKFSAKDVLFTYDTLLSDKVVSPYSSGFRFVKSVRILDEYTLEVTYTKPYFKALETWMMGILPKHLLENETNLMSASFNKNPIGTGPYRLEQLEFSKNIVLKAFEKYYEGEPKIEKLSFHVIADPMTRFMMLKSGELDVGALEPMAYEKQLGASFFEQFAIYEKISPSYSYLGFNLRLDKFKDPRVREALSLAINRDEIVDILFFKHARVCTGPFLPGTKAYNNSVKTPKQNIQKAKELLQAAGYTEENPLRFEIATSNSSPIRPYAAEILQHQLKAVGVYVTLRVMEWQAFLNMVVMPHKFESILLGWGLAPTPDPYLLWHSESDRKGGFNLVGYHNEELDKLIEESQSIVDRDELALIWQKMFAMIVEDNPYLFLYIPNEISAVDKRIQNIEPALSGIWHNYIEWEKED
ncbi:MAG: peptide-binding protein [Campylobacterales bacterium]|nr:peptide-binding protein [Campylobacterales bacterium]